MDAPLERRSLWFADLAWLGEPVERVTIGVADGRIASLTAGSTAPPDATHLRGLDDPPASRMCTRTRCIGHCGPVPRLTAPTSGHGAR